jgi:hypothetical protein
MYIDPSSDGHHNLTRVNDRVIKKLAWPVWYMPNWYDSYKVLQETNNYLVKVYNISADGLNVEMEYLDIICNIEDLLEKEEYEHLITKEVICNIMSAAGQTMLTDMEYAQTLPEDLFFIHGDFTLSNIVLTKDMQIKVIDPDSYGYCHDMSESSKYFQTLTGLGFKVQRHYGRKGKGLL